MWPLLGGLLLINAIFKGGSSSTSSQQSTSSTSSQQSTSSTSSQQSTAQAAQAAQAAQQAAQAAQQAAQAAQQAIQTRAPATQGGSGVVPVRARANADALHGPVNAENVRAAQALALAQSRGQGTPEVIAAGQRGMGLSGRDVDGRWGPRTVARLSWVLGTAGEQASPSTTPRQRAARVATVYVATGGRDRRHWRAIQQQLGVPQTGTLDPATAAAIQQELAK